MFYCTDCGKGHSIGFDEEDVGFECQSCKKVIRDRLIARLLNPLTCECGGQLSFKKLHTFNGVYKERIVGLPNPLPQCDCGGQLSDDAEARCDQCGGRKWRTLNKCIKWD